MTKTDPDIAREFAVDVVRQLRVQGFDALFAGGCVRDQLLGRIPKDYDVATNAKPTEVRRAVKQRTIAIGASFGVMTVLGSPRAGQVEVATFRQDSTYSDGRHPDAVTFSTAREDALRRDFTINGLFWDPIEDQVVDFVDGRQDLRDGVIRSIGDPRQRIDEDKLRMLRAIRFAALFEFAIDPATFLAIQEHAEEIAVVSAERVTDELRRMLCHPNRRIAVELLLESRLLTAVIPEAAAVIAGKQSLSSESALAVTVEMLERLRSESFAIAMAILLRRIVAGDRVALSEICRRGKFSNLESQTIEYCLANEEVVRSAEELSWARVQPVLSHRFAKDLVRYSEAVTAVLDPSSNAIQFCRDRLSWPRERLDPPPLISGDDLQTAGVPRGPIYRTILQAVRDAQLQEQIISPEAALDYALDVWAAGKDKPAAEG